MVVMESRFGQDNGSLFYSGMTSIEPSQPQLAVTILYCLCIAPWRHQDDSIDR